MQQESRFRPGDLVTPAALAHEPGVPLGVIVRDVRLIRCERIPDYWRVYATSECGRASVEACEDFFELVSPAPMAYMGEDIAGANR